MATKIHIIFDIKVRFAQKVKIVTQFMKPKCREIVVTLHCENSNIEINMGKSLKLILASVLCMLVSTACGGNNKKETGENEQTTNGETVMAKEEKALVVFFSHAGDNYAVETSKLATPRLYPTTSQN